MSPNIGKSRSCVVTLRALIFPAILSRMQCMLVHVPQSCRGFSTRA